MKIKNIYKIVCMLTLIAVLAACGKGEILTKTFEKTESGLVSVLTYRYQNDRVLEQTATNTIPYSFFDVTTKEEAEKQLAQFTEAYKGIEGITHSIEYRESEAIETLKVEYDKADIAQLRSLPGMDFSSEKNVRGISMKKSEKSLISEGYIEKK